MVRFIYIKKKSLINHRNPFLPLRNIVRGCMFVFTLTMNKAKILFCT